MVLWGEEHPCCIPAASLRPCVHHAWSRPTPIAFPPIINQIWRRADALCNNQLEPVIPKSVYGRNKALWRRRKKWNHIIWLPYRISERTNPIPKAYRFHKSTFAACVNRHISSSWIRKYDRETDNWFLRPSQPRRSYQVDPEIGVLAWFCKLVRMRIWLSSSLHAAILIPHPHLRPNPYCSWHPRLDYLHFRVYVYRNCSKVVNYLIIIKHVLYLKICLISP